MTELGPLTEMAMQDPLFAEIMWKMTPASMAVRLSQGRYLTWNYVQLLSRKLVDVAMGRCKRLIVCMPPRHGKSELVSKWFPAWYFETFPERKIILASYEADFAAKWGGRVRDIIQDNQELLSVRMKAKNPAQHYWETSEDGAMVCAGVGGPITGKGGNILIIDDYVKNSEEANSRTIREKTWDWWTSTARTRLEPYMYTDKKTKEKMKVDPSVIVMATRWNSDDLIGRLIDPAFSNDKGLREEWEVFVFPAEAEPEAEQHYQKFGVKVNDLRTGALSGEANAAKIKSIREQLAEAGDPTWRDLLGRKRGEPLCPDRFNERDLALFRGSSLRDWYALYQQRPGDEADDGNTYHRFDERKHCRSLVRNERTQLFISLDFNVNPMSCIIGQYERGTGLRQMDRCEVLEEISLPNSNTPDMMGRLMFELLKYKWGYSLDLEVYGDCAGSQRSPNSSKTNWMIVAEYLGMDPTLHPRFIRKGRNPTVADRINAVNTMLESADTTVRMFIDDLKCPELVKDFKKVRMAEDSGGNSTGVIDKSNPLRTHMSDALGYAIEYLFGLKGKSGGKKGLMQ